MYACTVLMMIAIFFLMFKIFFIQGFNQPPKHRINEMGIRVPMYSRESGKIMLPQRKLIVPKTYTDENRHLIEYNLT